MRALVVELERETHGVGIPKPTREALRTALKDHHEAFMAGCEAAKLSKEYVEQVSLQPPQAIRALRLDDNPRCDRPLVYRLAGTE